MEHLHAIERLTKRKIARRRAPSLGEVLEVNNVWQLKASLK